MICLESVVLFVAFSRRALHFIRLLNRSRGLDVRQSVFQGILARQSHLPTS